MINYDLPNNREQYIHRIGRSGRYGRKARPSPSLQLLVPRFPAPPAPPPVWGEASDPSPRGAQGVAINFVKNEDVRILRDIEQYYSTQIDEMCVSIAEQRCPRAVSGCWIPQSPLRSRLASLTMARTLLLRKRRPMNVADLI